MKSQLRVIATGFALFLMPIIVQGQSMYQKDLAPMLQQYCGQCHGSARGGGRGGVNFASRAPDGKFIDFEFWNLALHVLEDRSMPEDAERMNFTEVERQKMIRLIRSGIRNPDLATLPRDPGPFRIRLITQYEYGAMVRDLFGVASIPENKLPADGLNPDMNPNRENFGMSSYVLGRYLTVAQGIVDTLPKEKVVTVQPTDALPRRQAAQQMLKTVQTHAYRRPVSDADMTRVMKLYDEVEEANKPFDETMRTIYSGVLASPKFILRIEQQIKGTGPQPIDQYDLASRLSFFIWSSIPDDQLMELAAAGKLADPTVIEQQVKRMLADPRAKALAENFGMQWLGLKTLRPRTVTVTGAAGARPTTRPNIAQADLDKMRDDAVRFLSGIFHKDTSLLALLDDDKGGVLNLSAMHYATAAYERTSPTRRGKWVQEVLFGEPQSPGVSDTCRISRDTPRPEGQPLYDMLTSARNQAACAACHERLDPPGMALERFDALGRERPATGTLTPLKLSLLGRKDEIVRTIVERMLAFALGRPIEPADQSTVKDICDKLAKNDYRSSVLVLEIAKSFPFNYRRPADN